MEQELIILNLMHEFVHAYEQVREMENFTNKILSLGSFSDPK